MTATFLLAPLKYILIAVGYIYIYIYIYNFTELQVSRVIIVLLLQNCFVWCKDHTHQAIFTTELLELEGWQLNAKI